MAQSSVSYLGDGTTSIFTVTFPSLSNTHVSLFVDGVEDTGFTWVTESTISASSPPANGAVVVIQRTTPTAPLVDFDDGSNLIEELLDTATRQALYVAEESADSLGSLLELNVSTDAYDLGDKRMTNVATPVDSKDAVTKEYADASSVVATAQAIIATAQAVIATDAATDAQAAAVAAEAFLAAIPANVVVQTSSTGSAQLPSGTTAEQDGSVGSLRFNTESDAAEILTSAGWDAVGGGATGGGNDKVFLLSAIDVTEDYTVPAGHTAISGSLRAADGVTITGEADSRLAGV